MKNLINPFIRPAINYVKVFYYYQDRTNAWVAVKRKLVDSLQLSDKFCGYSFQRKDTVYLDDYTDAQLFFDVLQSEGCKFRLKDSFSTLSKIHSFEPYVPTKTIDKNAIETEQDPSQCHLKFLKDLVKCETKLIDSTG